MPVPGPPFLALQKQAFKRKFASTEETKSQVGQVMEQKHCFATKT